MDRSSRLLSFFGFRSLFNLGGFFFQTRIERIFANPLFAAPPQEGDAAASNTGQMLDTSVVDEEDFEV
jgi:hypothetical protein